ncbi:MAG: SWIM zinc finger domain-containing protein [Spirochaetes bacterium]|nr:SWIM zinc finger domain-containing protein [Spirochaetota bacterium]
MRTFAYQSEYADGNLALALAPALTRKGIEERPNFFTGFAVYPQVFARGLLVLAEITNTRYFKYIPTALRDPVLTAQGDRLRAECFSACGGVYARLDLMQAGFDGNIDFGTTNVDIGQDLRQALNSIKQKDKMRVTIGSGGLQIRGFAASHFSNAGGNVINMSEPIHQRPVKMPPRWIRALGNAAEIHRGMKQVFSIKGAPAQMFVSALPSATGKNQAGWLTYTPKGIKLMPLASADAVFVSGLHRLSALKRVMTNVSAIAFYAPENSAPGHFMVGLELSGMRITISLTADASQGYSGEGALLESLAGEEILEDAGAVNAMLDFDAAVNESKISSRWGMDTNRLHRALAYLAVSGKLGFDTQERAYFHRELPQDPGRVLKDNPRLAAARKLVELVEKVSDNGGDKYIVRSKDTEYVVSYNPAWDLQKARCSCEWYSSHLNRRGPCKHILAVKLRSEG